MLEPVEHLCRRSDLVVVLAFGFFSSNLIRQSLLVSERSRTVGARSRPRSSLSSQLSCVRRCAVLEWCLGLGRSLVAPGRSGAVRGRPRGFRRHRAYRIPGAPIGGRADWPCCGRRPLLAGLWAVHLSAAGRARPSTPAGHAASRGCADQRGGRHPELRITIPTRSSCPNSAPRHSAINPMW